VRLGALKSSLAGALAMWAAGASMLLGGAAGAGAASAPDPGSGASTRVEARSSDLLAVGTVHGDRMTIHLSRISDNSPVRDAAVAVAFRGTIHPTVAETDGSYSLRSPDLGLPGAAALQFQVTQGTAREDLNGTLQIADQAAQTDDKGSSRQLGWWLLNFGVCIGFLWLWSRRKKKAES
jgi:hypothetical protein